MHVDRSVNTEEKMVPCMSRFHPDRSVPSPPVAGRVLRLEPSAAGNFMCTSLGVGASRGGDSFMFPSPPRSSIPQQHSM